MDRAAAGSDTHTVGRWLSERAAITPQRIAVDSTTTALSYQDLARRATGLARSLQAAGCRPGDRVATLTANSGDHVVALFACAFARLVLAPMNWRLAAQEVGYQIDDCTPRLLLTDAARADLGHAAAAAATGQPAQALLGETGIETAVPVLGSVPAPGAEHPASAVDTDPLLLIYTSGTTGRPKGALLTHANCFWTNLSLALTIGMTGDDVVLAVLPQFHVGGWNVQPLLAWWAGATVVMPDRFDAGEVLSLISAKRVTTMMGVPATYQFLAEHPAFTTTDLTSLRLALVGGAPMPEALLRRFVDRGVRLTQGYGLTEAAPNVLCLPPEAVTTRLGWAGKPYPYVQVALATPGSSETIDGPGTGELLVRGPNVFAGYHNLPAAGAEALRGGWLHTGDIAERDADGYYRLRDRIKDMYVSGGENVYPAEVESVLSGHPDVAEAAVIGVADRRWGEVGHAVVVPRKGSALDEDAVLRYCRERMARYKVPSTVTIVDALPRSGVGKIDKAALRNVHHHAGSPS